MSNKRHSFNQNLTDSKISSDIKKEIEKERKLTRLLKKSVEQWNSIVDELDRGYGNKLTVEDECKTRYMQQRIHNESLQQQITSMKAEILMLKHRRSTLKSGASLTTRNVQHMENLQKELLSMKGLRNMYERQLDQESEKYFKAKTKRDSIMKDVWFQQQSRIDEQQKIDKVMIERIVGPKSNTMRRQSAKHKRPKTNKVRGSVIKLPSINGSHLEKQKQDSYSNIHDRHLQNEKRQRRNMPDESKLPELDRSDTHKKKNLRVRINETPTEYT